jgi:hypothetical protein
MSPLALPGVTPNLTGNWVARQPRGDGTTSQTYLSLKQDGAHISGAIRASQFYYTITDSSGGADDFTIIGTEQDGTRYGMSHTRGVWWEMNCTCRHDAAPVHH